LKDWVFLYIHVEASPAAASIENSTPADVGQQIVMQA
jgi:hypothetical protein